MDAPRCKEKSSNYVDGNSVVISCNTINQMIKNDDIETRPRNKVTSTPMSGSNNNKDNLGSMDEVTSPEPQSLESNSHTPNDLTPIYKSNTNMPVVTPLRSIISKSKANNTDKHVTFSDMILTHDNDSSMKSSHLLPNTPEINRNLCHTPIATFELSR